MFETYQVGIKTLTYNRLMKTIILISCASKKLDHKAPARELYCSPLFRESLLFANSFSPASVYILSAKYGLLSPERTIAPYNLTLKEMNASAVRDWASGVAGQLGKVSDLKRSKFILLAGQRYRKYLIPYLDNFDAPLQNMPIGKQLQFLKTQTAGCPEKIYQKLHDLFNGGPHHSFPFDRESIPKNGLYILFQNSELAHGGKRIVRVGTHTGDDKLPSRLREHFLKENKDRSIFRKNIGRAILQRDKDTFLDQWEIDLTSSASKAKYRGKIDTEKLEMTEKRVSRYIRRHFSFVVFPVKAKEDRLKIESRLISTISHCTACGPGRNWLGNQSPKSKIRKSGLWLVNELYKTPLSLREYNSFRRVFSNTDCLL